MRGLFERAIQAVAALLSAGRGANASQPAFSFQVFRLLGDLNFARWSGVLLLSSGTWHMAGLVDGWLVERLTGSGVWIAWAANAAAVGTLIMSLVAGRWADRPGRRRRITMAWLVVAGIALSVVALTATGVIFAWGSLGAALVCLIAGLRSAAYTVGVASGRTFQPLLVGEKNVDPAGRLGGAMFIFALVPGAALTGWLVDYSIAAGFAALVMVACAAPLLLRTVHGPPEPPAPVEEPRRLSNNLAWKEIRASRTLLIAFLILGVSSGLAGNFNVLLPLSVRRTWDGDADLLGVLAMAVGLGQMAAALYCLVRPKATFAMVFGGCLAVTVSCVATAAAGSPTAQFLALLLYGGGSGLAGLAIVTIVPTQSDPAWRGRAMSVYTIVGLGSMIPGALIVGGIATAWGPPAGWMVQGGGALVATALATWGSRREKKQGTPPNGSAPIEKE